MIDPRHVEAGVGVLTVHSTDALSALRQMPDESVQCVVTSPPYWGLRDYGLEPIVWDNHNGCEHQWRLSHVGRVGGGGERPPDNKWKGVERTADKAQPSLTCQCGAWRGCLGLEPSPELYVQHVVQIFRDVRRVLRKDGSVWLNLGDSYNGYPANITRGGRLSGRNQHARQFKESGYGLAAKSLKPKDLVGIPWMVAFALRADGWYLRSDIIWSKPNPMPESVTDRPTKAHEYIFLLTKSQKYFYDAEAIKEPSTTGDLRRPYGSEGAWALDGRPAEQRHGGELRSKRDSFKRNGSKREQVIPNQSVGTHRPDRTESEWDTAMRNKRSVWEIPTAPFPEAHFATFPKDLVIPCVLAGSKAGGVVLDPFGGSGTVGKVAIELGRKAILIEPNPEYVKMIEKRTTTTMGLPLHQDRLVLLR